jgi:hypothetical protein
LGRLLVLNGVVGAGITATIQPVGRKSLYYVSLFCTATLTGLMQAITGVSSGVNTVSSVINQVKGYVTLTKPL